MKLINVDNLIATLQRVKEQNGGNAEAAIVSCSQVGSDRYGVGFGLIVGNTADIKTIKSVLNEEISNEGFSEIFSKVEVIATDYEYCGCLY